MTKKYKIPVKIYCNNWYGAKPSISLYVRNRCVNVIRIPRSATYANTLLEYEAKLRAALRELEDTCKGLKEEPIEYKGLSLVPNSGQGRPFSLKGVEVTGVYTRYDGVDFIKFKNKEGGFQRPDRYSTVEYLKELYDFLN